MKKIKLLAPIIGAVSTLGVVLPAVSCKYDAPEIDDLKISIVNTNTDLVEKAQLKIDSQEMDDDGNLILNIKWTNADIEENIYYYPYLTSIQVDKTIILQKSDICPYGFTIIEYSENVDGYKISVPATHLKKGSVIEIDVNIQETSSEYDFYCNQEGTYEFPAKSGTYYNVVKSETRLSVSGGSTAWFAADLTEYLSTMNTNDPIFFGIAVNKNQTLLGMDPTNIWNVFIGDVALEIEKGSGSGTTAYWIQINAPAGGWDKASAKLITGHYTFNRDWYRVTLMFGQPQA